MATSVIAPMPTAAPVATAAPAAPAVPATSIQQALAQDFAAVAPPVAAPTLVDPMTVPAVDPMMTPDPAVVVAPAVDPAAPVVPAADPVEDAPLSEFADITPDSVSEDGKRYFYNPTKKARLEADHHIARELREVIPEFSVDVVKQLAARANSADLLMSRFRSGPEDLGSMDAVLNEFFEADPHAFGVMAIRAMNHLPTANPEAARAIESQQNMRVLNQARARIGQIADPVKQQQEVVYVQNMEMRLQGRFTPAADLLAGAQQDPAAAERAWIESQRREINQFHQTQAQQQKMARVESINQAENSAIDAQINSVLDPLKANPNFKPEQIQFMKSQLENQIRDLEQAHPEWGTRYTTLRMEAERTGSPDAIQAAANFRRGVANQAIARSSANVIKAQTALVIANNQAAHVAAATVPTTELSPNGVTAPAPNGAVDAMLKAKTWDQMFGAMKGQR